MDPTTRRLELLGLLQSRAEWSGSLLAEQLGVSPRTLRRDVSRLRDLGYTIDSDSGPDGGYRLAHGQALPPLVLSDDEAVAVAVGLRAATVSGITGLDQAAIGALAKVETTLPARLRGRVRALGTSLVHLTGDGTPSTPGSPLPSHGQQPGPRLGPAGQGRPRPASPRHTARAYSQPTSPAPTDSGRTVRSLARSSSVGRTPAHTSRRGLGGPARLRHSGPGRRQLSPGPHRRVAVPLIWGESVYVMYDSPLRHD